MRRAVFLDRDGTIIVDENYLSDASKIRFLPGIIDALRTFRDRGLVLVLVSNQSGIPRGLISPAQHEAIDARLKALLAAEGVPLEAAYYCVHLPESGCTCRKPLPGMIEQAAREHDLDPKHSIMIGDKPSDIEAGRAAGCVTALLGNAAPDSRADHPDHCAADWPSLLSSLETSWKT
jgi:D-glycero-D-manno-heptose 1,7-bisphosphate phosphatase